MNESRMTPEIAERYKQTVEWWRANALRLPPPLPFEVSKDSFVEISSCALFGDAFIDEKRFYAEGGGGHGPD